MVRRCVVVYVCYGDTCRNELNENPTSLHNSVFELKQGRPRGGDFAPNPSLKGPPGDPMKGPSNTCLKDRYTLMEQSDLDTLIEQSQYSSEEQCSKLITTIQVNLCATWSWQKIHLNCRY